MTSQEFYKEFEKQARQMGLITLLSGFYLYLDTETDVLHDQMRDTSNEQEYKKYAKELVALNAIKGDVDSCIKTLFNRVEVKEWFVILEFMRISTTIYLL